MDESTFQEGMARLIRITNRNKQNGGAVADSPEKVGEFHICKMCNHVWKVRKSNPNPNSCPSCHSTVWNSPLARKITCARCGHEWKTNIEHPTMCPKCKSRTYDSQTLIIQCKNCGTRWEDTMNSDMVNCPTCGTISKLNVKILPRVEDTVSEDVPRLRNEPLLINREEFVKLSMQSDDYSRFVYLNKIGYSPSEADILIRYMNKQKPVNIALELKVPLGLVFETIAPFIDAAESEVH